MTAKQNFGAYSAPVDMWMIVNGQTIGITHMGPNFLLVESTGEHPPGEATVVLQVAQNERRWTVRLPDGIRPGQKRVQIAK